ncbi:MAG: S-adenosylmethionine:tRNA ribosyltransferase-isomerase, partial [Candidatus Gastranaerophilaceae bacterium]
MLLSEYDYNLPEELIAQMPADKRENSRMMVLSRKDRTISHKHFYDIVDLIDKDTLLVMNNTKVLPARLIGHKETGAKIEVFLLKQIENDKKQCLWDVLIKPSKRVKPETVIKISDELSVKAIKRLEENGEWLVELIFDGDNMLDVLHRNGNIPLPPYIERKIANDDLKKLDFERYQTVYAKDEGSVAAPTAGLHFTEEILQRLQDKGVELAYVTLNVGLGTFRPVQCD